MPGIPGHVVCIFHAAWRLADNADNAAQAGTFNLNKSAVTLKRMRWMFGANVVHKYDYDSMTCAGRERLSAVATAGTPAETYGYDRPGC